MGKNYENLIAVISNIAHYYENQHLKHCTWKATITLNSCMGIYNP